jgi:hypothetical protein
MEEGGLAMVDLNIVGTDDTPVWMAAKNPETGKYEPTLVAWYSIEGKEFLTSRTFSTQEDAQSWINEFWQAVWRLGL